MSVNLLGYRRTVQETHMFPRLNGKVEGETPTDNGIKPRLAVDIRGLRISYGRGNNAVETLRGIDLTLPEGKIYGLLGPSGCGKTTLLRCVVGRLKPRHGKVLVFGQKPGSSDSSYIPGPAVGYMPQELTLYPEFSIVETLTYFGRLFRLENHLIRERTAFLVKFLGLPEKSRLVKNLSGGQKRRVSLAAALVHRPPLLILDEPTVGVDPLLRQSIWHYLVTLTHREGITVIVTTHYIEEARLANIVGLMRQGRMLAQAVPDTLMEQYGMSTLEDVFLKLCMADANNVLSASQLMLSQSNLTSSKGNYTTPLVPTIAAPNNNNNNEWNLEKVVPKKQPFVDSCYRTWALVRKSLTRLHRNLPVLLFTFLVPSIQVILFCLCIGSDPFDLQIGVVNQDYHPLLSTPFLQQLDNVTLNQVRYKDLESAIGSVKKGETWGVISIGSNFSTALQYRFLLGVDADNKTIQESSINVYLDMTNQQIGYTVQKAIFEAFASFTETILKRMNKNPALAQLPVVVKPPIYGVGKPSFTEFMAPGIIISITYIMAVGLTAISIVSEQKEGLLERSWVAGVRPLEVILSHVICQYLVMFVQVSGLLIFTFLVFEIPSRGPFVWVVLLTLLQGCCGMTYGLLISSMCVEENSAIMLALASFYPNLLLSGVVWPTQAMPYYMRYISYGLPQTIPTESLRCILSRGWGIEHTVVWLGFVVSAAWCIVFLICSAIAFRLRK
ncbi:ABC transporter G family member 20-like isoform X3 [Ornithodoros turicata]|uniref:ABC transporter G family member 20-like isoform X3 n=1 Tax=Ornithodoros turicata TaxID=34597 RepID=UPI00313919E6